MAKSPPEQLEIQQSPLTVVLPCDPADFKDFISDLLGKPQTINRKIHGCFEVRRENVENLHHLIDQRITAQNEANLIQFTARIIYSDNTSVLLNSFDAFTSYNELKPMVSSGLHLSWTYLIKFQNKRYPEKQKIDVSFTTKDERFIYPRITYHGIDFSQLYIQIDHTDRTWGADMDALLDGYMKTLRVNENKVREWVGEWKGVISFLTGCVIFLCFAAAGFLLTEKVIDKQLVQAKTLSGSGAAELPMLAQKVDFILNIIASGIWTRYVLYAIGYIVIAVFVSVVCAAITEGAATFQRPSFVLLTQKANEERAAALMRLNNSWLKFGGTIVGAIALGVLGNYVFYLLVLYFGLS